ncbi:hypothetical protein [Mitsuokella jalaludinii]|uniref:hypothetical protein n=1 Tax=Mitsuokella jalaludinii TaxID=187979 RepID=UPI00307DEAC4
MVQEDVSKVMKLLVTCRKAFPSSKADAETLALYVKVLAPLSYAEIEAAVLRIMRTSRFFPTAAEIFEAAEKVKQAANNTGLPDAGEAWHEVEENVYRNHVYHPWTYSCPEVEKAVKRFGKKELCSLGEHEVNTARAQFMKIYNEIVARRREDRADRHVLAQMGDRVQALIKDSAAHHALPQKRKDA